MYVTVGGDNFCNRNSLYFNHLQRFGPEIKNFGEAVCIFTGKNRYPGIFSQQNAGSRAPECARKPADSKTQDSVECSIVSPNSTGVIGNSQEPA